MQQAGGFNPTAFEFVPGGAPASAPAPSPAPATAPAPEVKEESWESAPNVESTEQAAAPAAQAVSEEAGIEEEVEKLDMSDEALKKELEAMKAEGLIDEEEEAEIVTGKKKVSLCSTTNTLSGNSNTHTHTHTHTHSLAPQQ